MFRGNKRRDYFIDKKFQKRFILKFCSIVILASIIIGGLLFFFSRGSTTVAIENTRVTVKTTADFILPLVVQTLILVTIFSAIAVALLALFDSHKIAGPLYRFRREIEKLEGGKLDLSFHIRAGDQLKDLADALSGMVKSLKERVAALKKEFSEFKSSLENIPFSDRQSLGGKLKRIEEILGYFKD